MFIEFLGCRVIGFAGSDDKVKWLKNEIGFDAAYNYKKIGVDQALNESAPNGVDCYFDNVNINIRILSKTVLINQLLNSQESQIITLKITFTKVEYSQLKIII